MGKANLTVERLKLYLTGTNVLVLKAKNVTEALTMGVRVLDKVGVRNSSRNGEVIEFPEPVTTVYVKPWERVLFSPARDANPFFHFFESLWMLAGRNDLAFLTQFVKSMADYSDDGETLHGAYGYRWRNYFDCDQLEILINELRNKPDSRRCVLQHWEPKGDLGRDGKDVPCFSGDTILWSPEGDTSLASLVEKFSSGELTRWPVFSVDPETSELKLSWCTNVWKSGRKKTVKLTFDDGSHLIVTPDHRLYRKTRNQNFPKGKQITITETFARDFKPGDRIWATHRLYNYKGYEMVKRRLDQNTGGSNQQSVHREHYRLVHGDIPDKHDVHHQDENKLNQKIQNLKAVDKSVHGREHKLGDKNPMRHMSSEQHQARAAKQSKSLKENWKKRKELSAQPDNHVVVSVEEWEEQDVYDFTVPGFHTALVGTGIVAHNCNTAAYFLLRNNRLSMSVTNRSNDMIWGAYGANAVHFSMLQEYVAGRLGVGVGPYYQISNNLHVYTWNNQWELLLNGGIGEDCYASCVSDWNEGYSTIPSYHGQGVSAYPLFTPNEDPAIWDGDLRWFLSMIEGKGYATFNHTFFEDVALPIWQAWDVWSVKENPKDLRVEAAKVALKHCKASDWQKACSEWLDRRMPS